MKVRSIVVGLIVGSIMCFSNMYDIISHKTHYRRYFGLQTGWVTMGSLQSTLLGFGAFVALQKVALKVLLHPRNSTSYP